MRIVTTDKCSWAEKVPRGTEIVCYTADEIQDVPGVEFRQITHLQGLQRLEHKYSEYVSPSWQYDFLKAAKRIYALTNALSDYKGIGVWLDSVCSLESELTEKSVIDCLPRGNYMGMFSRLGMPTKTDFYVIDCSVPEHQSFMLALQGVFETETFQSMTFWTDGAVIDSIAKKFNSLKFHNLSGAFGKEKEPMKFHAIGEIIKC